MPKIKGQRTVETIDAYHCTAILNDDTVIPVVTWYDQHDFETDNPQEAYSCVAGSEAEGWFAVDLVKFGQETLN